MTFHQLNTPSHHPILTRVGSVLVGEMLVISAYQHLISPYFSVFHILAMVDDMIVVQHHLHQLMMLVVTRPLYHSNITSGKWFSPITPPNLVSTYS